MDVKIREAKSEDLNSLLKLFEQHAKYEKSEFSYKNKKEKIEKYLFEDKILSCIVIEKRNQLIAYMTFMKQFSTWDSDFYLYMDCLFINEEFRNKGLGKKLIEELKKYAKKYNCTHMQWQTPNFNKDAIKFYKKIGAKEKAKKRFFLN